MLVLSAFFFALYLLVVAAAYRRPKVQPPQSTEGLSVIVAFRNEEGRIGPCLNSILASFQSAGIPGEVIAVNDHSTDHSLEEALAVVHPSLMVFSAQGVGKKSAVTEAANRARFSRLAFTDADAVVDGAWVQRMAAGGEAFTAGWVQWQGPRGWLTDVQRAEGLAVMQLTAASYAWGIPLSANGACMAMPKALAQLPLPSARASGDDVGRLQLAVQEGWSVQYDPEARVTTQVATTVHGLWQQRKRWASKTAGGGLRAAQAVGLVLLFGNFSWVLAACVSWPAAWAMLAIKTAADAVVLHRAAQVEYSTIPWRGLLLLQPVYPLYLFWLGLVAPYLTYRWKARELR